MRIFPLIPYSVVEGIQNANSCSKGIYILLRRMIHSFPSHKMPRMEIYMFGFVIWSIVTFIFMGIGISCWNSKEVVGFFTFAKPPQISSKNVNKYNHAVSILWFVFAVLLEIIGLPLLFVEQNSPIFIFVVFGVVVLVFVLIIVYLRIEAHYKK